MISALTRIAWLLLGCILIVPLLSAFGCKDDKAVTPNESLPGGPGNPVIELIQVPSYGKADDLKGQIWHAKPAGHNIVVCLYKGGWWNKPVTSIHSSGLWTCDVTTEAGDERATKFSVFLIPDNYQPPTLIGEQTLPPDFLSHSVANFEITRTATAFYRTSTFSGYDWTVKSSSSLVGPGPNFFSSTADNVWLDSAGQLHLKITTKDNKWYCGEVVSQRSFGYGRYIFHLATKADQLNENIVLGLFTWDDAPEYTHREIDIEFSRWGVKNNDNAQFVVQPWDQPGNIRRYNVQFTTDSSRHSFEWKSSNILFQSYLANNLVSYWNYAGKSIPVPGNENARINLWLMNGWAPSDKKEVEMIIKKFEFIP